MRRRRSEPTAVGALVGRALDDLGLDALAAVWRLGERWEEAVGSDVARHCRPVGVRDGPRGRVLEAEVASSVWAQQLTLRREEILAALARVLGDEAPRELRFRVGYTAAPVGPDGGASRGEPGRSE